METDRKRRRTDSKISLIRRLARIEEKINGLADRQFFDFTGSAEKNWEIALGMAREAQNGLGGL